MTKSFAATKALDHVTFRHASGVAVLLGPNGAGKTTLLRCLATLMSPDSGEIEICSIPLGREPDNREARRILSYMPQKVGFSPSLTVKQHLDRVAVLRGMSKKNIRREAVAQAMESLQLTGVSERKIKHLSGGLQRRVGLAQTVMGSPDVLLLDEPTAGLDPEQRVVLRSVIGSLAASGVSVLISTHQPEDVLGLTHTVLVLKSGRILYDGPPDGLAALAMGQVGLMDHLPDGSVGWPTQDGRYRVLGIPDGSEAIPPTLEDGYLTLMQVTTGEDRSAD
ncbi:MAG: ABC transporter ATP-binding protein [Acidimicrobiia bacterium]